MMERDERVLTREEVKARLIGLSGKSQFDCSCDPDFFLLGEHDFAQRAALAAKDARIKELEEQYVHQNLLFDAQDKLSTVQQELARVQAHADQQGRYACEMVDELKRVQLANTNLQHQLDTLLGKAVWAMKLLECMPPDRLTDEALLHIQAFLSRPDVRARQKEDSNGTSK